MSIPPLVSVAMPVRNGERHLAEAVESILGQSFRDFEFIIVDDASTDGTWGILEKYAAADSRVRLLRHKAANYLGAMNACCQAGRGRYIARMDADDVSFPDRLERQVREMENRPEIAVLGGNAILIDDQGRHFGMMGSPTDNDRLQAKLLRCNCFVHPTTMVRREAMEAVGWFRPCFATSQDYDLWLRISERFQLAGLGQPVLYRRYHPTQVGFTKMVTQVTCSLSARAAARMRRDTGRDPLDGVGELTPQILLDLGIHPDQLNAAVVIRGLAMARHLIRAGYLDMALSATKEAANRARTGEGRRHALAKAAKLRAIIRWRQRHPLKTLAAALAAGGHYLLLAGQNLRLWTKPSVRTAASLDAPDL